MLVVLCRVGIHRGQWGYVSDAHCIQTRRCQRCGITKLRTKHQRVWHDVGTCVEVRTCRRCWASSGRRTRHGEWSAPRKVRKDWEEQQCLRCGAVRGGYAGPYV